MSALQPDARTRNTLRTSRAKAALLCFRRDAPLKPAQAMTELLCGLMHWADAASGDFEEVLARARRLFDAQCVPEPSGKGPRVTFVRTIVPPPDPRERRIPYWMEKIREFDRLDLLPHVVQREPDSWSYFEPCKGRDAEVWVVTGRYRSGAIEPCEPFPTKAAASVFRHGLISACPHLGVRRRPSRTRRRSSG